MDSNSLVPTSQPQQQTQQQLPVIPWETFIACGVQVHKDGKNQPCLFDPRKVISNDEAFQCLRLIVSSHLGKTGIVDWNTVPDGVKKHFVFKEDE